LEVAVEQLADAVDKGVRGGSGAVPAASTGGGRKRGAGGAFVPEGGAKKKAKTKAKGGKKGKGVELVSAAVASLYGDGLEPEEEEERFEVESPREE
jgi:hypothetical protein